MATANGSSKGTDEVEKQLKDRMVATGEWSRLVKLLKDKLAGSAWEDGLRSEAEEYANSSQTPNIRAIIEHMAPIAQRSVPDDVRAQITSEIRKFVEQNVEA